ncbi:hypothetical protein, partial [Treponema endosymbiont of Eucomonympha sp.]|uniref:hypothetical protein n=1 Tax=Treponema endosymbiont of Eucomonympha sp. TaxID=1580831 RepID=UPI001EE7004D
IRTSLRWSCCKIPVQKTTLSQQGVSSVDVVVPFGGGRTIAIQLSGGSVSVFPAIFCTLQPPSSIG